MAITATPIYDAQVVPTGSATQVLPVQINLSAVDGSGVAFNFVINTGYSPGPNANIKFRYAFSMGDYDPTLAISYIGNSSSIFNIRCSNAQSAQQDITTQFITPILGNYLYCWLDVENMVQSVTLTASAIPLVYPFNPKS